MSTAARNRWVRICAETLRKADPSLSEPEAIAMAVELWGGRSSAGSSLTSWPKTR